MIESRRRGFEVVTEGHRVFPKAVIQLPKRKTQGSMAADFYSNEEIVIQPGRAHHFMTDVKAYMSESECLVLNVRSSIGFKKNLMLVNTQGWIDQDFYGNPDNDGNIGICLFNFGSSPIKIDRGERIAQGAFFKFLKHDGEDSSQFVERTGGIGSTGVK